MKRFIYLFALIVSVAVSSQSCKKSDTSNPVNPGTNTVAHTYNDLMADTGKTGHYTFFRFKDSTIVSGTDSNTTNWDIAFQSTNIIVNASPYGPGQGSQAVLTGTTFSAVTMAPATGWTNEKIGGWYSYDPASHLISMVPGVVIVIKTADGKYAKMSILNYYKGNPTNIDPINDKGRFITFKFAYQPDGSMNF